MYNNLVTIPLRTTDSRCTSLPTNLVSNCHFHQNKHLHSHYNNFDETTMSHPSANTRSRSATPNNTPVKALPGSVGKMFSSLTLSLTEESEDNVKQAATSLLRVKLFGIFGTNPKAHEDEQTRAEFLSLLEKYTKAERVAADDPILCIASKCFGMKEYKLVLVGGASVGKSAYVEKLKSNRFISKYEPTKKVDVTTLVFNTNQYPIKLDIWDITACFDGYYVGADAAIMMYDVSSKPSMKELNDLYKNLVRVCVGVPIVLTGNKKESSSKRKAKQQNDAVATFSRKNKLKVSKRFVSSRERCVNSLHYSNSNLHSLALYLYVYYSTLGCQPRMD